MKDTKDQTIWTSGGRKTATARIKLQKGKGAFVINDMAPNEYFPLEAEMVRLHEPFDVAGEKPDSYNISIKVSGGGKSGQLDACRHALAKALEKHDPDLRPRLKRAGLLTRDARKKERKKYGLKKARRAPQFSKR